MSALIQADELYKGFSDVQAVDGVSFEVEEGEVFGFLGPNGAGKTTTVRMITGVLEPDSGTAWVNGKNVREEPTEAKEEIGIAPEVSNAYIDMTGWQNMMLMGELYGVSKDRREKRGKELLELFSISDRKDSNVKGYSKGMQQRLVLAMALIHDPPILFLDEPTAGLDVQSQRLIKTRIREMNEEGKTIFLTTHNIPVANELCDRVAVINHGKIAAIDTPEKLKGAIEETRSVEVGFENGLEISELKELEKAEKIEKRGDKYRIYTSNPIGTVELLLGLAKEKNEKILSIRTLGPSLEDAFVELTGGDES
ncbi:ATP-binding protein [candidate division MSBL1 archaeon SCGC-AAA261G05]|uniref:ATP-binding protein n=2 Tax=candidate division MSBL1 TaxID=215777 RepID=A0A133VAW9_9EURY|nr:ATP-binding protein [candidate division MSBL1 archaeon SCGC-AAA261G05]KXB04559.1 ATP-binding protein [candidate division MSBL1 archaeon SCGC-AAA261O19]